MNTYSKLADQWCIRSDRDDVAGQAVMVSKRNGAAKLVQLGDRVGGPLGAYYYAIAERPAQAAQDVGDLSRILAMFDSARQHLRFPAVVLDGLRVNVAGDRAREPGSLTITTPDKGADGRRAWLGRVTRAGQFEPARDTDPAIGAKLRAFAADPVGVAAAYGRLHGACCFCRKSLRDERSTAVGYGPTCAENFGLEWGMRATELEAA
jgi:hypothetical protein